MLYVSYSEYFYPLPTPSHINRDEKGLEVDVILELVDGRWAAVEIKLSDLKVMEKMWTNYMLSKKKCAEILYLKFVSLIHGIYCRAW